MAKYGDKAAVLCDWAARKFAGEDMGQVILWDPSESDSFNADNRSPTDQSPGFIRMRKTHLDPPNQGQDQSCDELWSEAVFELYNITSAPDFTRLRREAAAGHLTKEAYVSSLAHCETRAAEKTRTFYIRVYLPWAKAQHVPTDARLWYVALGSDWKEDKELPYVGADKHSRYWTNYELQYDLMTIDSLVGKGEAQRAVALAAKMLRRATTNEQKAGIYYAIGRAFFDSGDYDRAISNFSEAIRVDPKKPWAHVGRGWAFGKKDEYDKEIEDQNEAIRLDPRNALAFADRGWAYGLKGDYDKEIADETEAIGFDPRCSKAFTFRGWAYGNTGEHDKEIADYGEVIRLNPNKRRGVYPSWPRLLHLHVRSRQGDRGLQPRNRT